MLDTLIELALELREDDPKASFSIGKELALIEINLLWYPDKLKDNISRLRSLSQHVKITFKNNDLADFLSKKIKKTASQIENKYLNTVD